MAAARHTLPVDRDWTRPEAGGTGTVLRSQVVRWLDAGHRVTVVAGAYHGAETVSRPRERLAIHRRETESSRAALVDLGMHVAAEGRRGWPARAASPGTTLLRAPLGR